MSSWKKASKVNQKTHRERHQPEGRQKYGLLEKKKDYKVRARHHQERERVLKLLKKRAENRNPDEFYFHMTRSKVEDGRHTEIREEDEHTEDQIKLMQTRDLKYINMRATMERKKVDRLQSELHFLDQANKTKNNHIFFDNNDQCVTDLAEKLDTHPDLVNRKTNRLRLSDLSKIKLPDLDEDTIKQMASEKRKSYRELERRKDREKELSIVQRKLEIKTHLFSSKQEPPKKIKPATKDAAPIYKWKYERKKRTHTIISKLDVVTTSKGNGFDVRSFAKQEKLDIYDWPVTKVHLNGKYDIGVVVSFGRLISEKIINHFPLGIINVHASLLPRWRGAAPIIYTILNGDLSSGVTIMKIQPRRFDIGEIVRQHSCIVDKDETAEELKTKLADMGAHLLVDCFKDLSRTLKSAVPQPENGITYAPKVKKSISVVDWDVTDSNSVYNMYRALCSLWPLTTTWHGTPVKLLKVCRCWIPNVETLQLVPGQLVYDKRSHKLSVKCGGKGGFVSVEKLKISGHKTMSGKDFFNGFVYMRPENEWKFDSTKQLN